MREIYEILYKAAHKAPNGISPKVLSDEFGISLNTFNKRINPEYEDRKFPIEDISKFCLLTGDYTPINFICEKAGGAFIKFPSVSDNKLAVHIQCMESVKKFGNLMEKCSDALSDGVITKDESDELDDSGYHAICSIMLLLKEAHRNAR